MSTSPEPQAAVSVGCGCLCDDVLVRLDSEGRVVGVEGGCESCRSWFLEASEGSEPSPTIDGQAATPDEALDGAVSLLRSCRAPLLIGLGSLTNQAQAVAVALGERIGGAIEGSEEPVSPGRVLASLRLGSMTASWGEVRSRADLILFWGCEPIGSHLCFWDRFVTPPGRFVPDGRAGRTILAAAGRSNDFLARADRSFIVPFDRQAETLHLLSWLASGGTIDSARAEASTGVSFAELEAWASALRSSRYGAIVVGTYLLDSPAPQSAVEAMLQLVRSRNKDSRFAVAWLDQGSNPTGAEAVLTRQTGSPGFVDFASGSPRFLPLDACFSRRHVALTSGGRALDAHLSPTEFTHETDLVVRFAQPYPHHAEIRFIRDQPVYESSSSLPRLVTLPTSTPGLDTSGTITRSDEIPIPLRSLRPATLPSAEEILTQLLHRLEPRP